MYFLLVSQRAEPYDEFLEIGRQEDSVFGFFWFTAKKYLERRLCTKAEKFVSKVAQQAGNTYLLSFKIKKRRTIL